MRCPQCQTENTATAKFCRNCGTRLFAPPPVTPATMKPAHCPHCQAEMPPGARFCKACGQARESAVSAPAAPVAPATEEKPGEMPAPRPDPAPSATVNTRDARLICILGALQGMTFRAGSESGLVIGRSPGADVRVPDPEVSKLHAWVGISGQRLTVRDLKSTNGTYLNDRLHEPVSECELREGDILVLGRHNGAKFRVTFVA